MIRRRMMAVLARRHGHDRGPGLAPRCRVHRTRLGRRAGRCAHPRRVRQPAPPGLPRRTHRNGAGIEVAPASFGGLFAPAGTPEDRIARIKAACATAAATQTCRTIARTSAQLTNFYLNRADLTARLQTDIARKAEVLRGVRLN